MLQASFGGLIFLGEGEVKGIMSAVIFAYCFAGLFVLVPLLSARGQLRRAAEADGQRLVAMRQAAESTLSDYLLGAWSLLCLVGGLFFLRRGNAIGWPWLGVAMVYALGIIVGRWSRRRLLAALGDRGRVERTDRYKSLAVLSHGFVAAGVTSYVGQMVVEYAYPKDPPSPAEVATVVLSIGLIASAVGFPANPRRDALWPRAT